MRKKVLAMLLAAAFAGTVLSGCGNAPAQESETAAEAPAEEEEPEETAEEPEETPEEEEKAPEETEQDGSTVYLRTKATMVYDGEEELVYETEYDDHGNPLKVTSLYDGTVEYAYEYNEAGQVTKATQTVVPEYSDMESYVQEEVTYEYDGEGVLLKGRNVMNELDLFSTGIEMTRVWDIEYTADGEVAKSVQTWIYADGSREDEIVSELTYDYEYDGEGRKIKKTGMKDGVVDYTEEYEYDEAGRMRKKTETSMSDGNPAAYVYEYEYDENGNQTKETWLEVDGNGNQTVTETMEDAYEYEYDENGNVVREVRTSGSSGGDYKVEYLYEYTKMIIPDIKYYRLEDGEDGKWHFDLR